MDLFWQEYENGKNRALYVGCQDEPIAYVERRAKWWFAYIELPGVNPNKEYAPVDVQIADIEEKVLHWFGMCNTHRPSMERHDA